MNLRLLWKNSIRLNSLEIQELLFHFWPTVATYAVCRSWLKLKKKMKIEEKFLRSRFRFHTESAVLWPSAFFNQKSCLVMSLSRSTAMRRSQLVSCFRNRVRLWPMSNRPSYGPNDLRWRLNRLFPFRFNATPFQTKLISSVVIVSFLKNSDLQASATSPHLSSFGSPLRIFFIVVTFNIIRFHSLISFDFTSFRFSLPFPSSFLNCHTLWLLHSDRFFVDWLRKSVHFAINSVWTRNKRQVHQTQVTFAFL